MHIYLVDGTYELFRHYHAVPSAKDRDGREIAAVRGVLASMLGLITHSSRYIAVATDHVIESFRNGLWRGYKTSAGVEPDLLAQFPLLEEGLRAAETQEPKRTARSAPPIPADDIPFGDDADQVGPPVSPPQSPSGSDGEPDGQREGHVSGSGPRGDASNG